MEKPQNAADQSSGDQNASRNVDNEECAHEVSKGNGDSTRNRTRGHTVIFRQRNSLHFAHFLRFCMRLNVKEMEKLT